MDPAQLEKNPDPTLNRNEEKNQIYILGILGLNLLILVYILYKMKIISLLQVGSGFNEKNTGSGWLISPNPDPHPCITYFRNKQILTRTPQRFGLEPAPLEKILTCLLLLKLSMPRSLALYLITVLPTPSSAEIYPPFLVYSKIQPLIEYIGRLEKKVFFQSPEKFYRGIYYAKCYGGSC